MKLVPALIWFSRVLVFTFFTTVVVSAGEPASFVSSLSLENKTAAGIIRLTEQQVFSLDEQVQREIAIARQGDTVAFSISFTRRRTPAQRREGGLDRLMTPELTRLDALIAAELANRPLPAGPPILAPAEKPTTATASYVEMVPRKMEIHGEVSFVYAWGSGGARGYGASMVTTATDPAGKYSITVALSQFNGKGFGFGCRRHPYSPYYYDGYDYDRGW